MQNNKNKTVILTPRLGNVGGVASFYVTLKPLLGKNVTYIYRGKDIGKNNLIRLIVDYVVYGKLLRKKNEYQTVVINTSLGKSGIVRDGFYGLLAKNKLKAIVFFHGWNPSFEQKITNSTALRVWLNKTFFWAEHIIVLSSSFQKKLREWGYKGHITVETTAVDEGLLKSSKFPSLMETRSNITRPQLLYLGNIAKAKGIWEVTNAVKHIVDNGSPLIPHLTIAGSGVEVAELKKYVAQKSLPISFAGYVKSSKKAEAFQNAHLFVFASLHEGMPISLLEAMAFGLPIITTRVGGIPDFFEDGKMGLFLDNRNPEHIAERIQYLLNRPELMKQMAEYNYNYAKEHFYASKVAKRLEAIIESVVDEQTKKP